MSKNIILLKKAIRKLVIQEITNNQFGTSDHREDKVSVDALKKATGDDNAQKVPGSGKIVSQSPGHTIKLVKSADDLYDVESVTNESDRKIAKSVTLEDAVEFIKSCVKDDKSYVQSARDKSISGGAKINEANDVMKKVKSVHSQQEIADSVKNKSEKKVKKELSPLEGVEEDSVGGTLVDKINRAIEKVLSNKVKADSKTAYLKADKDKKTDPDVSVKLKSTPKIK
jgi:hypothetical protein